jgi:signal transduction histidine kinase
MMRDPLTEAEQPEKPKERRHLSLTIKLVAWVGLFSTLFTLVMTVTLVTMRYQQEQKQALAHIQFIANSYSKSLANSLWEIDMVGAQLQMEALSRFPMVGHALLISSTGQTFHLHQKRPTDRLAAHVGSLYWEERLVSPLYDDRVVGHLTLYVDNDALLEQVRSDALRILAGEVVKGFLLGMLITWMLSRLVTRHLSHMARHTAALLPTTLDQPIRLHRGDSHYIDELDQLCTAFNQLHHNLVGYNRREEMQAQLVMQEKLAALGALVAGVAHELNTPLGNSLMMTSALQEKTAELNGKMEGRCLQHAELVAFIADAQEATGLIMRGLSSAAELVNDFKQVAVDRTTAHRRVFDLQQTLHELVSTMMRQIRPSGHQIELDISEEISMDSYPGPLGQVISSLIGNAMLHAFEGRANGQMRISAQQSDVQRVRITFADNGVGIKEHHLKRIFDPFFTTKMGQGSGGLGLNISYNIITTLLNGQIAVESIIGQNTIFIIDLPLTA